MPVLATRISGDSAGTVTKGAIPVAPGDFFEFFVFTNLAEVAAGGPQTHMTLTVLQAT